MRTIESAFIFPFVLISMVYIIFLSFDLHDIVLYKAASYKYLTFNNPNSQGINSSETDGRYKLSLYVNDYSLSHSYTSINVSDNTANLSTSIYDGSVSFSYYDKCDLKRKTSVASDLLDLVLEEEKGN